MPLTRIALASLLLCGCYHASTDLGDGGPPGAAGAATGTAGGSSGSAGSAGGSGGVTSGTSGSSGGASGCPTARPADGSGCSVAYACEYGADPDINCDAVLDCDGGAWEEPPPFTPDFCTAANANDCPEDFATLVASEGECTAHQVTCAYPEGRCDCTRGCGMGAFPYPDGGVPWLWCCEDTNYPLTCPSPRPRLGTPCDVDAQECDYGGCWGNVRELCAGGVWVRVVQFGCPG